MTENDSRRPIRRALISVYDKTGLAELARGLHEAGVDIVSTGSTAKTIADVGVPVTPVEEVTGFPEVLDGRVKTLHPNVHAGLLADQRKPEHVSALADLGIAAFELVVVNLYPFTETVDSGASVDECVEQIDIGGVVGLSSHCRVRRRRCDMDGIRAGSRGACAEATRMGGCDLAAR
jgi:phosphoribosylaminoimidazolecarboxamide formyltransferase/IMP cyclohydrolase